jgi:prolyl-tRNA editing enzyme YbaK/EbsC (Cys-tRNA(Pro) deacylase)
MDNKAVKFLKENGLEDDIIKVEQATSAQEAAQVLQVELSEIAKSLTFRTNDKPMMIVMSGDAKIDSNKFRKEFRIKSKMLDLDDVMEITGYEIGGVCPFAIDSSQMDIFFDVSLKRHDIVYPGAGSIDYLVKIKLEDMERLTHFNKWIDIGKNYEY